MSRSTLAITVTDPSTARYLLGGQLGYLARAGLDVHLITSPGPDLDAVRREQGIRCSAIPIAREMRPFADLRSLLRLVSLLRRERPLGINASTPKAGLLGLIAAVLTGVPIRIYTVRGLRLETTAGLTRTILTVAERIAARCAQHVVLVSESLLREYLSRHLATGDKTRVLGQGSSNGVDCTRFQPRDESEDLRPLAREAGLDPTQPVIGFVGRLVKDKGIHDLAIAFEQRVLEEHPDAQLLIIGDFEPGDPVAASVRGFLSGDKRVKLMGFREDPAPWYRLMDVLAFPSYREGFPNAPLEAAATAVPVAGYAATGTIDAVEHGVTGTLVATGDAPELGRALCRYLEDDDLRHAHGRAGRERALGLFSQERVWTTWCDLYRELEVLQDADRGPET